jgi:cell wall assembly regulator SMI1
MNLPEIEQLSIEQLATLEGLLAEQGAPVVRLLRRPASTDELSGVESNLGLSLPAELRTWWEWHDGTDEEREKGQVQRTLGPMFHFEGTARAIESTQACREIAIEVAPEDPESQWHRSWVSIVNLGDMACDCAVGAHDPVPVVDGNPHYAPGRVAARSLGEMVRWWVEALEGGAWVYRQNISGWERNGNLVPPERDLVRLV